MRLRKCLLLNALGLSFLCLGASPGMALGYDELLEAAVAHDAEYRLLGIAEERALVAMKKAALELESPALALSSGSLGLGFSDGAISASASPSLSLSVPGYPSLEFSAPFALSPAGGYTAPSLSLSLPLIKKGDEAKVAAARAEASHAAARYARSRRRTEVEKAVAEALREAIKAEAEIGTARRKVEVAALALEKARKLDGAEPGGKAWLTLDRERKVAERGLRDATAARTRGIERLALLSGLDRGSGLLPPELPASPLGPTLPRPESLAAVRSAFTDLDLARLAASESAKERGLKLRLGADYASGLLLDSYSSGLAAGAEIDAGLGYETDNLAFSFELGWRQGLGADASPGPTMGMSLAFKPGAKGFSALESRDRELLVVEAEARAKAALETARGALRDLEYRREDLEAAAIDIAEDLEAAREELALYGQWRDKGAVSDAEYREVLAFADEAESRARLSAVERLIWSIDLELLGAGTEGGER